MSDPSTGKTIGWIVGGSIGAVLLLFVLGMTAFGLRLSVSDITGRGNAEMTVQAAPYRLTSYERFYDQCASIRSLEYAIDAHATARAAAETADDRSRATTNLTSTQAMRAQAIEQYNADARKENAEGQYRDVGLPYQIPTTAYEPGQEKTSCGA